MKDKLFINGMLYELKKDFNKLDKKYLISKKPKFFRIFLSNDTKIVLKVLIIIQTLTLFYFIGLFAFLIYFLVVSGIDYCLKYSYLAEKNVDNAAAYAFFFGIFSSIYYYYCWKKQH